MQVVAALDVRLAVRDELQTDSDVPGDPIAVEEVPVPIANTGHVILQDRLIVDIEGRVLRFQTEWHEHRVLGLGTRVLDEPVLVEVLTVRLNALCDPITPRGNLTDQIR